MSRNSKNAQRHRDAAAISEVRKKGGSGPAKTVAKHGKRNAWWQTGSRSYRDYIKGGKVKGKLSKEAEDTLSTFIKRQTPAQRQQADA